MLSHEELAALEKLRSHYPDARAAAVSVLRWMQRRRGYISDESLRDSAGYLGLPAAELEGLATFYNLLFRKPVGRRVIKVCDSVSCWMCGYEGIRDHLRRRLGIGFGETTADGELTLLPAVCLGNCDRAPSLMVNEELHGGLDGEAVDRIIDGSAATPLDAGGDDAAEPDARASNDGGDLRHDRAPVAPAVGGVAEITPIITRDIVPGRAPLDLAGYRAAGGYQGLRVAIGAMSPEQVRELVTRSNLRGRGGAGFPTGVKWGFVPQGAGAPRPKYVIANGDEMEPGTFKDRLLIHGNPHQLVEAMVIAGWALQADIGYFFLRPEYERGAELLAAAIDEAAAAGLLGDDILGSGWSFELHAHTSAGRYICGEETALLNALEGKRPNPRSRPPYPAVAGLWGKPTIVQNIETLACLPHIVVNGDDWFRRLGLTEDAGTKLYCVSGMVARPGNYELPIGVTLRELIFEHCGGMRDGREFKAALPGGASTMFMTPEELDTPLDFTHLEHAGNRLGTAGVIVADRDTSVVGMVLNLMHFFAQESCGWCTPCREGLPWIEDLLRDLVEGRGRAGDPQLLAHEMRMIGPNSFCALALGAEGPLLSALEKFPEEFEAYVRERHDGRARGKQGGTGSTAAATPSSASSQASGAGATAAGS